ncbi:multinuclear nonheme iron-dependent oxidase, partial [Pseudomonas aeruginosa]
VTCYVKWKTSSISETQYLSGLRFLTANELLLDGNNVDVSARTQDFDPWQFILELPHEPIRQIHMTGRYDYGQYLIDTNAKPFA